VASAAYTAAGYTNSSAGTGTNNVGGGGGAAAYTAADNTNRSSSTTIGGGGDGRGGGGDVATQSKQGSISPSRPRYPAGTIEPMDKEQVRQMFPERYLDEYLFAHAKERADAQAPGYVGDVVFTVRAQTGVRCAFSAEIYTR
jgi:hypothetical protein